MKNIESWIKNTIKALLILVPPDFNFSFEVKIGRRHFFVTISEEE